MKRYNLFLLIACLLLFSFSAFKAISDPIEKLIGQLLKYTNNYPQEKIHLHTDKSIYLAGDTIWIKGYLVNAENNRLSTISNVVYIDLVDNNTDSVAQRIKLPVEAGLTWGNINLPFSLNEGGYKLRAYTKWMKNFDSAFFFEKPVAIGNIIQDPVRTVSNVETSTDDSGSRSIVTLTLKENQPSLPGKKMIKCEVVIGDRTVFSKNATPNAAGQITLLLPLRLKPDDHAYVKLHVTGKSNFISVQNIRISSPNNSPDLQFFPEGGYLINGIHSRVALKVTGANGKGISAGGYITDEHNAKVATFQTEHAGFGTFYITPKAGSTYKATINSNDRIEYNLPTPLATGFTLSINNEPTDKVGIRIETSPSQPLEPLILIAHMNGTVKYVARTPVNNRVTESFISKSRFATGIVHFTLFTSAGVPVAERLMFVNHNDQLYVDVHTDKPAYAPGEKVEATVHVKNASGSPVTGSFSVSVADESQLPDKQDTETSILSNLLLTSELKGFIEDPGYYFSAASAEKERHLDLLMLTQGWSRFSWKKLAANDFPPIKNMPEKGLAIDGKVLKGSKTLAQAKVSLRLLPGVKTIRDTITDAQGKFRFDNLPLTDSARVLLLAEDQKGKNTNLSIELSEPDGTLIKPMPFSTSLIFDTQTQLANYKQKNSAQINYLKNKQLLGRSTLLKEVRVTSTRLSKIQEILKPSSNLNGPGFADVVLTYLDLQNYHDMVAALQGKIAGVVIKRGKDGLFDAYTSRSGGGRMLIVIDGITSPMHLDEIDVHNIQSIEVLKSGGYLPVYGFGATSGILVITTKRGGIDYESNVIVNQHNGFLYHNIAGFSVTQQFYTPVYGKTSQINDRPDLRTTLYWNPNLLTDNEGKTTFSFPNNSHAGKKKIVIEGLTAEGKLGHKTLSYAVKQLN